MIWQTVMGLIFISKERNMKGNGKMIFNVEMVLRFGQMELNMKEIMKMVKSMGKELYSSLMQAYTEENS